jgi:glucose/arabinose dehydrogenase
MRANPGRLACSLGLALGLWAASACNDPGSAGVTPVPRGPTTRGPGVDPCTGTPLAGVWTQDSRLCVRVFASGLGSPRQMAFAPNGDLFVNNGTVMALWDKDGDGQASDKERSTFGVADALNHGLTFSRDYRFVYASSQNTVYRWTYTAGQRSASGPPEVVIKNIPGGGHSTRTLVFDSRGRLYVSVGSGSNVDTDQNDLDTRGQIRRYTIPERIAGGGMEYLSGEVFARGLRNEVGLYVDGKDNLWGVENGRDNLVHDPLGGDIHDDNPGEEINFFDGKSPFYGYPLCWSEFKVAGGLGPRTQWGDQSLPDGLRKTDAWCRDAANVRAPMAVMQAHWAPLGILQYTGNLLPFAGDLLVTSHGSWNRSPATGRLVAHATLKDGQITALEPILGAAGGDAKLAPGNWDVRPVDLQQGPDGAVYVSDDSTGRILRLGYPAR